MKRKTRAIVLHAGLFCGVLWVVSVSASPIPLPVTNFSFEVPAQSDGGFLGGSPPGWNILSGTWGVYNVTSVQYPGTSEGVVPAPGDGFQVLFPGASDVGTIAQTLTNISLQPSTPYTLTVAIGHRSDYPVGGFKIELFAGATSLGSFSGNANTFAPSGGFANATVFYESPAVGVPTGDLRIELSHTTSGDQPHFDNVRLSIPEGSSLALLGISGMLLAWHRSRALK